MRTLAIAVLAAATLALPAPASAAWGWTTWGMSARDVIAGSGGRVEEAQGNADQRVNDWWLLAAGDVTDDGFDYRGEFYFDRKGKDLHVVRLSLKDPSQCDRLKARMTSLHGAPRDDSKTFDLGARTLTITALKWDDDGKGDFLALTSLPGAGSVKPLCFIRYRPLDEPDPRN